ncbi:MAG: NUDIX domain-containing protein [Clostridiales bacterium]|nr:NUDIX domain-containing protein [Clostridiales bacterium]
MRHEKSCGAVIFSRSGRILLIHQQKGHWGFPKGHTESGETEEMTALREIKEEVGLDVRIDNGFREVTRYSPCPGVMKDVVYFVAHVDDAVPPRVVLQPEEVVGYEWATPQGARNALTFKGDRDLLEKALGYVKMS